MKRKLFSLLFMIPMALFAQSSDSAGVTVEADARIDKLIEKRKEAFRIDSTESGFRIQIYSTTDRKQILLEEEKFKSNYPELALYMKYDSPNFKLRVGDFKSKLDAQYWFNKLQADYPTLFLVPDKVNP